MRRIKKRRILILHRFPVFLVIMAWSLIAFLLQRFLSRDHEPLANMGPVRLLTSNSGDFLRDSSVYIGGTEKDFMEFDSDAEQEIYPELAYRLSQNLHDLDSPDAFAKDQTLAMRTRFLQHRLRSLGLSTAADMAYYIRIFQFARDYGMAASALYENLASLEPAISWRYFCYRYLDQARVWELPSIAANSDKEAVFVETRWFPHVEFVIRAVVKNLGPGWMLTIVCSEQNEALMQTIATAVSANVRILRLRQPFTSVNGYNNMMLSTSFWRHLYGEKILIFQEDSILFRPGIDILLPYDFVGSPWPSSVVDVASGVGNGGISLRSRSVMLEILNRADPAKFSPSENLRNYMTDAGLEQVPEDVFFAQAIERLGIGRKAPRDVANLFTEGNPPSRLNTIVGGHQFWLAMRGTKWLEYAHDALILQLALPPNTIPATCILKHRGGWKHVLKALINHDFLLPPGKRILTTFIKNPRYEYVDVLEQLLIKDDMERWKILKSQIRNDTKLVAFMHGTVTGRFNEDILGLHYFWSSPEFKLVRSRLSLILTFSNYFADHVRTLVDSTPNVQAGVMVMSHPFSEGIVERFDPNAVLCKACKKRLIALGQQHRYTSTIYLVNTTWDKYWMPTSMLPQEEALGIATRELGALGVQVTSEMMSKVNIIAIESYRDYERFVATSVVLVHVRDANANNAVLDAIAMNTPIIVNRNPSVEEYLGAQYPLFFDDVVEIQGILEDRDRIEQAAQYLRSMDKSRFLMTTFLRSFHKHVDGAIHYKSNV